MGLIYLKTKSIYLELFWDGILCALVGIVLSCILWNAWYLLMALPITFGFQINLPEKDHAQGEVKMAEIGLERDLDLGEHETGYEWEAGETPPDDKVPGKWIVRKDQGQWTIFFRSLTGAEYNIYGCPLTEIGERIAKITAIKMVDIAWGK